MTEKIKAQNQKYHYIYKTTCNITSRYYIGMHSTNNLEDGYLGSGKRLQYSIIKHGKENHSKEILEFLETRELLKEREKEIVNEELIHDINCMNLVVGGEGGNRCSLETLMKHISIARSYVVQHRKDPEWLTNYRKVCSDNAKAAYKSGERISHFIKSNAEFRKRAQSEKAKTKRKATYSKIKYQQGENNSQYGTCWIYNPELKKSIRIIKEELQSWLDQGWIKGRKIKF